ncbi:MAG TPA: hypothetical protein VFW35_05240 [Sphingomicrobium sp.]|nr:hypothetical protein [Sphingomicrobium sp.]
MSARSFGSLFMVASCAGAALGCYLVSLRVASERAAVEDVEARIVSTQGDLRLLQTEIGTRGRLSQLERWNAGAFELSAPAATQFVQSSFELAKLTQPERQPDFKAPLVLASAPAPQKPQLAQPQTDDPAAAAAAPDALLHEASLKTETREVPAKAAVAVPQRPAPKSTDRPVTAAKPAPSKSVDMPGLAAAKMLQKKSVDKPALASAKPVTKRVQVAKIDPLAPLSAKHSGHSKDAPTGR